MPGPSPVPERALRDKQVIDHRGPGFQRLGRTVLEGVAKDFAVGDDFYERWRIVRIPETSIAFRHARCSL
jgi:hypothetical protein